MLPSLARASILVFEVHQRVVFGNAIEHMQISWVSKQTTWVWTSWFGICLCINDEFGDFGVGTLDPIEAISIWTSWVEKSLCVRECLES